MKASARQKSSSVASATGTSARVEPTGAYALDDTPVTAAYTVGQTESGEYRLTSVPRGLHLQSQDRERSFTAYDVYFLRRAVDGTATARLVPDRVFLPVTAERAPSLVEALLRGATLPLSPAVASAVPEGTAVGSPVADFVPAALRRVRQRHRLLSFTGHRRILGSSAGFAYMRGQPRWTASGRSS